MPLLSFQQQFVQAVENGLALRRGDPIPHPGVRPKTQTIRAYRKDGRDAKPGQTLYMYEKARQPDMRKLDEIECASVDEVFISKGASVCLGGRWCFNPHDNRTVAARLARDDGFENWARMLEWFEGTHGIPFRGVLIRW